MPFRSIFVAVTISGGLLLAALLVNNARPVSEVGQPRPELVRATGRCAQCHRDETAAVVHQFERSEHSRAGVTCLDCHQPHDGQEAYDHYNFRLARDVTALSCRGCHRTEYEQFARSRHALPAWSAVRGTSGMSPEQIAFGEERHPGAVDRPANALAALEGEAATAAGCLGCHQIGRPNPDGSIGSCTECHSRHSTSIALAREPQTCGQCHMGPDHAQLEIYTESKHGALYAAQRMVNPRKAYPVDPGLISLFAPGARGHQGRALETAVLLELERRGRDVSYVRTAEGWEVDFCAQQTGEAPWLVQVCLDTADDATWEREVRALRSAGRTFSDARLLLVTLDASPPSRPLPDRVVWTPAARWLLGDAD